MRKPVYAMFMPYANNKGIDQPAHPGLCCLLPKYIIPLSFYSQNFKPLPSFCGYAGWFESYLVANPKDRFSRDVAHFKPMRLLIRSSATGTSPATTELYVVTEDVTTVDRYVVTEDVTTTDRYDVTEDVTTIELYVVTKDVTTIDRNVVSEDVTIELSVVTEDVTMIDGMLLQKMLLQ